MTVSEPSEVQGRIKCDCIEKVNKHLIEHNTEISLPLIGRQQPFIQTNKINEKKRGKPALMFATFCPFCGVKYPEESRALISSTRKDERA